MADNDVRIKLSLDGAKEVQDGLAGVGDSADKTDSKLGGMAKGGLKGAGKAFVGLAATAAVSGAAMSAAVIHAYADYEQNLGGIETLFGKSADTMKKYADEAYKTAGLSANEYMANVTSFSASLLQGLGGDTDAAAEIANQAMIDMSDNVNKFGSNIADVQNAYQGFAKQNYTMLDNLKLGYGGTQAEMARLINDSGVLGDTFTATASNLDEVSFDKIIEAIHVVQTEMGVAGTTALEAEQTISGSVGMLQSSFQNLLVGLGSADADVATLAGNVIGSLESVLTNVAPVISNIGDSFTKLAPQLGGMAESLVEVVIGIVPDLLNAGVGIVDGLVKGITNTLPKLVTALVPALVSLVKTIAKQLPLLLDAGIKAVTALVQGISQALPELVPVAVEAVLGLVEALIDNAPLLLEAALEMITALGDGLLEALPVVIDRLPELVTSIVDFLVAATPQFIQTGLQLFLSLIEALPQIIVALVAAIPQIVSALVVAILGSIPQIVDAGIQLFVALIGALPEITIAIVAAIPQIVGSLVSAVVGSIPQMVQAGFNLLVGLVGDLGGITLKILGALGGLVGDMVSKIGEGVSAMVEIGKDLIRGIWEGIKSMGSWLKNKIGGFGSGIVNTVKGVFGINSPSRLMRDEVGRWLPAGIADGFEQNLRVAVAPVDKLKTEVVHNLQGIPSELQTTVSNGGFTPGLTQMTATPPASSLSSNATTTTFNSPLISISGVTVRSDEDIRALSEQLRTDMTRELRAQGVLVA